VIPLPSNRWARRGLGLLAGVAVALAMPPWGWWPLAPVGLAIWALLLDDERPTERALVSVLVAWGWFLPANIWMVKFTPVGWPIGVMVWFGALAGVIGALVPPTAARFVALPGLVVLWEWLRWHAPFGGVPLSMLAYTQGRGPLLPVARIAGSLGVSAAVAFAGAALGAVLARRWKLGGVTALVIVAVAVGGVWAPDGHPVRTIEVAAIQGGGPQETRSAGTDYRQVFLRHFDATERIAGDVDLVVWPENVVSVSDFRHSLEYTEVSQLAKEHHATFVVGVVEDVPGEPQSFLNQAVVFGPDGRELDRYDKVRRVPFGEYVPLRNLLDPIAHAQLPPKDAVVGTGPNVADTPAGRVGMVISWEVFFPRRVRSAVTDDAQIVLNPTNGSSYWLTQVQTQQIASSALRAVESGRWVVQAAPTGFSAVVDPAGNVHDRTAVGESAVVQHRVQLRDGATIAMVVGDGIAVAVGIGSALAATTWDRRERRRARGSSDA
jgi:apolipoprotein N-acyltransferase